MTDAGELQCLKVIALTGGLCASQRISSQTLADALNISPQTASRRLQALESALLIARSIHPDGQYVAITPKGEEELRREFSDYARIFSEEKGRFVLTGSVISGLGEGRYYVDHPHYRAQFHDKLGFYAYPGTLNIRLNGASVGVKRRLEGLNWITIDGFHADGRTFGGARCLPCRIGDSPCAIVQPGRSHYPDEIIEIISPDRLREKFDLKDSDTVTVEVHHV
ncbi:DUF120 domain-containing protein [Methanofollis fontis]|uniref:Riboflavin kinase n=1 Tax=Methanofollis fontis TaxID=2052832 RepID=A0A483CSQ2_9EURY|nr:DUF120 domain-containing protein [Methanofollis fontis]TAJ45374.1 riboflavin kinase [Methanofollis fontis]